MTLPLKLALRKRRTRMVAWKYWQHGKSIALPSIDLEYFDSSSYSWSANFDTHKIVDVWNMKEKALHINWKELIALYYSLRSFKIYFQKKRVKLFSDSKIKVKFVNKMVTTKNLVCKDFVKNICFFCVKT